MDDIDKHDDDIQRVILRARELVLSKYKAHERPARVTASHVQVVLAAHSESIREVCKDLLPGGEIEGPLLNIGDQDWEIAPLVAERVNISCRADPLGLDAIRAIIDTADCVYIEKFIQNTADSECNEPWQLMNRGNARATLGRVYEALEDFVRAIELDSHDPLLWEARAQLFRQLDMTVLAESDESTARRLHKKALS